MTINDAIDAILISLNDLLNRNMINKDDFFSNAADIIKLNSPKYKSVDDLIARLNWIKGMNMEHPDMPLSENHQLVIEVFDKFNELLNGNFDCYYTGGLMGYLATGHEYKIIYKGTIMSIGLFLFERQLDSSIVTKEYYFDNQNSNGQLFVDEHHFSKEYTEMSFSSQVREHNGIPYRMMSLERIYNSKKNSRPKDKYDAQIIKNNFDIIHKPKDDSVIQTIEHLLLEQQYNETSKKY